MTRTSMVWVPTSSEVGGWSTQICDEGSALTQSLMFAGLVRRLHQQRDRAVITASSERRGVRRSA
jgi:hypothetical protein